MLKKRHRLTRRAFSDSFARGKRLHSPLVQLIHDTQSEEFHGAVVVGKKVFRSAVARNRLRRRLYGQLYRARQNLPLRGVYIVIVKPAAKTATATEIKATLLSLIEKTLP